VTDSDGQDGPETTVMGLLWFLHCSRAGWNLKSTYSSTTIELVISTTSSCTRIVRESIIGTWH
jgi:hypothetical protein